MLGGRLGFVLFYQPQYYFQNPLEILMVWQGGMSFHRGFIGVVLTALIFCIRQQAPVLSTANLLALAVPPGLVEKSRRPQRRLSDGLWPISRLRRAFPPTGQAVCFSGRSYRVCVRLRYLGLDDGTNPFAADGRGWTDTDLVVFPRAGFNLSEKAQTASSHLTT